jgi:uncharacterized protein (DUF4415 family)
MKKKLSESSPRERRRGVNDKNMSTRIKKHDLELEALLQLSDDDIDTSDIPEVTDWRNAVVGKFYRPIKEPVTLRLDADIVAWFKSKGPKYQTRINALLRTAIVGPATGVGAPEGNTPESGAAELPLLLGPAADRDFQFPSLEEHDELRNYCHVAAIIQKRGSIFAPTA